MNSYRKTERRTVVATPADEGLGGLLDGAGLDCVLDSADAPLLIGPHPRA